MRNVRARFIQFYVILKWKECYNDDIQKRKQQQKGNRRKQEALIHIHGRGRCEQLMRNTTIKASCGRDNCLIFAYTKDFQSKQLNDTKVREIGWRAKAKIVQNWNGWRPQKKHMKCQQTRTQIHRHTYTHTSWQRRRQQHSFMLHKKLRVVWWISELQTAKRYSGYYYTHAATAADTDTSSSVLSSVTRVATVCCYFMPRFHLQNVCTYLYLWDTSRIC